MATTVSNHIQIHGDKMYDLKTKNLTRRGEYYDFYLNYFFNDIVNKQKEGKIHFNIPGQFKLDLIKMLRFSGFSVETTPFTYFDKLYVIKSLNNQESNTVN